jgi:adenylate cyclase
MPRNIEIKARAHDFPRQRRLAESIAETGPEILHQVDTFFRTPRGRLKLRQTAPDRGELIGYDRGDAAGPKSCRYRLIPTDRPAELCDLFAAALGVRGVVRKVRTLYWAAGTRIHLDEVDGLGRFLELEYVLRAPGTAVEGEETVRRLMRDLDIRDRDLVDRAYIDLLEGLEGQDAP